MRNQTTLLTLALAFAAVLAFANTAAGQNGAPIPLQVQAADQVTPVKSAFHAISPVDARGTSVVSSSIRPGTAGTNQGGQPLSFFPADLGHNPSGATIMRA